MARIDAAQPPEFDFRGGPADVRVESGNPDGDLGNSLLSPADEESQFLRTARRIPVRRGRLSGKTGKRLRRFVVAGVAVALLGAVAAYGRAYAQHDGRFRIESTDNIDTTGLKEVSRASVLDAFGADIGRNLFFVPLAERQHQLEAIPWVESATVERLLPARLRVEVRERTPVAFLQTGTRVAMIDAMGIILDMPRGAESYSFPVVGGLSDADPASLRAARMKIYRNFIAELDSGGGHNSRDIGEVDLSDPEDVQVLIEYPASPVLVRFGTSDFLAKYRKYKAHIQEWRVQFPRIASVDLRYDRQVIVDPGTEAASPNAAAGKGVVRGQ